MESIVSSTVFHVIPWGASYALYFFLIGMSAGAFILSMLPHVCPGEGKYMPLSKTSWVISFILLLITGPILIFDLTTPGRFIYLFFPNYWHMSSPLMWGTLLLMGMGLFSILYGWALYTQNPLVKLFGTIGGLFAIGLPIYTGFDLAVHPGRPVWHSAVISPLFLILSLSSGVGLVSLIAYFINKDALSKELLEGLRNILLFSATATFVMLLAQSVVLAYGGEEEHYTLTLIYANYGFLYWGISWLLGTFRPLGILLAPRFGASTNGIAIASALIILASYSLRHIILLSGQLIQQVY